MPSDNSPQALLSQRGGGGSYWHECTRLAQERGGEEGRKSASN